MVIFKNEYFLNGIISYAHSQINDVGKNVLSRKDWMKEKNVLKLLFFQKKAIYKSQTWIWRHRDSAAKFPSQNSAEFRR